ncbi:MAG: 7-cyano-7-deazaguanine synthase [Candidatus Micrarchaeia archaeon]
MKALVLLSGGLDSRLAVKLMQEQGAVEAVHFKLPFEGCCFSECAFRFAQSEGVKLHIVDMAKGKLFQEYMKIVRKPRFGYGSGMNPCIDCRVMMLREARELAKKIKADCVVTGEVLGERPMSQTRRALELIERESGLQGRILRPLSAKLLPETDAERKGLVKREKFYSISGRRRKPQLELAEKFKLRNFPTPGGGCLLCEMEFARKLADLFRNKKRISFRDVQLLKLGRHFRIGGSKIVVGRNERENNLLMKMKGRSDYMFEVPDCGSPTTILQGMKSKGAVKLAGELTAAYSDCKERRVAVKYGKNRFSRKVVVEKIPLKEFEKFRV